MSIFLNVTWTMSEINLDDDDNDDDDDDDDDDDKWAAYP